MTTLVRRFDLWISRFWISVGTLAAILAASLALPMACGDSANRVPVIPIDLDGGATCAVEEEAPPSQGGAHVSTCSPTSFATNPPASGSHYPSWAEFRAYDNPVPWGFLVHAMEHGAVVIAYNCPDGCADDVAAAKALMQAIPARGCGRPPVILTPDPTLTTRFAAAAWGHVLRAPCFDRARFLQFTTANANHGPEFSDADCGVIDLEAEGWCPAP